MGALGVLSYAMSIVSPQSALHTDVEGDFPQTGRHRNLPSDKPAAAATAADQSVPMITKDAQLRDLCHRLRNEEFLAIDTEFMRDHSYWPRLCLVQLAGSQEAAVIDPLHDDKSLDLDPLYELLRKPNIVKVFHAARQDVEIFFHDADLIPTPIFDTQIAAMVCGFGEAVSYATLVRKFLGASLDKSSRLTDWSRRPLSRKQLAYALDDVVHLRHVYEILAGSLKESGRTGWVEEEMARLGAPETYRLEPANAWKRLKRRPRSRRAFAILIEVAAWREQLAQQRNIPRTRILKDDSLYEVVASAPKDRAQLERLRAIPQGFSGGKYAASLLEAVVQGETRAKQHPDTLPKDTRLSTPAALLQANAELLEILKLLLKLQCERHKVASKLVADVSTLEAFAIAKDGDEGEQALLSGWRKDVFGALALEVKQGRIGVGMRNDQLALFPLDDARALVAEEIDTP